MMISIIVRQGILKLITDIALRIYVRTVTTYYQVQTRHVLSLPTT